MAVTLEEMFFLPATPLPLPVVVSTPCVQALPVFCFNHDWRCASIFARSQNNRKTSHRIDKFNIKYDIILSVQDSKAKKTYQGKKTWKRN